MKNVYRWLLLVIVITWVSVWWIPYLTWSNLVDNLVWVEDSSSTPLKANTAVISNWSETRIIQVDARKFSFIPNDIRVKQWEKVSLKINNIDMEHGAYFMDWETNTDNQWNIIVDTSQPWTQIFSCANMCGSGHNDMQWRIIVEPDMQVWSIPWKIVTVSHDGLQLVPNIIRVSKNAELLQITPESKWLGCMSTIKMPWVDEEPKAILAWQLIEYQIGTLNPWTYDLVCGAMWMRQWQLIIEA